MLNSIPLYKNEMFNWTKRYVKVYVKGYGFISFARSMNNKYGKKLVDTAKKSAADAIKTASKRAIKKLLKQLVTWWVIKLLIT